MTRFESSPEGSNQKRALPELPRVPRKGLLNGLDTSGLEEVHSHRRRHEHLKKHTHGGRHAHHVDAPVMNNHSGSDVDLLLGKRQSGVGKGNPNVAGQQQITGQPSVFNCVGSRNQLPDFR